MNKCTAYAYLSALSIMTIASCSGGDNNNAAEASAASELEIPRIEIATVSKFTVDHVGEYTANVEAFKTNNISTSIPNRIKQILVDVGSNVTKGQKLVVLDDVTIEQSRVRLENAEREYNRALKLFEIGGGTRQSVDQLKTELDASRRAYDNQLENTVLTSPVNGTVTARNYDPGDMTGTTPILTVEDINPVKIMIGVSETDFSAVKPGLPVKVTLDAYPGEQFDGKVTIIHPSIDASTRTFLAEVTLPNPQHRILPGMFARVEVPMGQAEAVVLPDRALQKQSGSAVEYVYLFNSNDSTVTFTKVTTGRRLPDSNAYEVIDGLADGATVVISGQSRLLDGTKALPIN